ncbi:hypothetical protein CHCC14431_3222 [Bacillus licheniformis]|nr:hypothetical protein CHCC14431_3222 [Bacillus licheniformis]
MPRTLWLLVIGMFINVTGASFLWPLNTIYIHQHLGKSLTAAGFVLMLNSGANVLGNLFGGYLFDKIGGFKTVVLGIVITFASLSGLVFFHDWFQYILFLTLAGFGSMQWPDQFGRKAAESRSTLYTWPKMQVWQLAQRSAELSLLFHLRMFFSRMRCCTPSSS